MAEGNLLESLILGVVQGLTEFLPVSSTGHLIIFRELLGIQTEFGLAFDAVLHLATALAVLIYFRHDFFKLARSAGGWIGGKGIETTQKYLLLALVFGTIPAVIAGLLLEDEVGTVFRSTELVAWALIGGSILFVVAEYASKQLAKRRALREYVTPRAGFFVGFFQALALIPGMSRSGATISGGLLLGLTREQAARFAFLLSLPIILGAGSKSALDLGLAGVLSNIGLELLLGALAALTTGLLAIHFLLRYLRTHTLGVFIVYRVALAVLILSLL